MYHRQHLVLSLRAVSPGASGFSTVPGTPVGQLVGSFIAQLMGASLNTQDARRTVTWIITGAIVGLAAGLVVWRTDRSVHRMVIPIIATGWIVAGVIYAPDFVNSLGSAIIHALYADSYPARVFSGITGILNGLMTGAIGGLSTGLVIRQTGRPIGWEKIWG